MRRLKISFALIPLIGSYALGVWLSKSDENSTSSESEFAGAPSTALFEKSEIPLESDISSELVNRPALSASQAIQILEIWIQSPNTLIQQFPLYDVIARAPTSTFPELLDYISLQSPKIQNEAKHVLRLQWLKVNPFSLAEYDYKKRDRDPDKGRFNQWYVVQNMAAFSLTKTKAFIEKRETNGHDVSVEYQALYEFALKNGYTDIAIELKGKIPAHTEELSTKRAEPHATPEELRLLVASKSYTENSRVFMESFRSLASADPMEALSIAAEIEEADTYTRTIENILREYSKEHPREALELIQQFQADKAFKNNRQGLSGPISEIVNKHPYVAIEWLQSHPDPTQANQQMATLLQWARFDNFEALNIFTALPDSMITPWSISRNLQSFAKKDWQRTNVWIDANLSKNLAQAVRIELIPAAFQQGVSTALELFENAETHRAKIGMARNLANVWANSDLNSAIEWAKGLDNRYLRISALEAINQEWVAQDPEGARAFAQESDDKHLSDKVLGWLARDITDSSSPTWILENLEEFPEGEARDVALTSAAGELAVSDPQAALAAIERLGNVDDRNRRSMTHNVLFNWIHADPLAAAKYIWPRGGLSARISIDNLLYSIASFDEDLAIEHLKLLPTEELRQQAYNSIFNHQIEANDYPELEKYARENNNLETAPNGR